MSEPIRYGDWAKEKTGSYFRLTGPQVVTVLATGMPALLAAGVQRWWWFAGWLPVWGVLVALTVVPVKGRSAFVWLADVVLARVGVVTGWSPFVSHAAQGTATDMAAPDLPGSLSGVAMFDGPVFDPGGGSRPVLIQNKAAATWAVTARVVHPGIGMAEHRDRAQMGGGLSELIEVAARGELISLLAVQIRTMPDTGTARAAWQRRHRRAEAHPLPVANNADWDARVSAAGVQHEAFVTVVVAESAIARQAKEAGGGIDGRAQVLYSMMREVQGQLGGRVGCTSVTWLDAGGLAAAIRTGYAPGDAPGLADAAHAARTDPTVAATQPYAAVGPSRAPASPARHYVHDAWSTVSCAVLLPDQGAMMGALAPLYTPTTVGERRSVTIFYHPLSRARAERAVTHADTAAEAGRFLSTKYGFKVRARQRNTGRRVAEQDERLAKGHALVRTAVVAAVTVASPWSASEHGRRLESSIRAAGFTPLRLDLAQPAGFVAACIPVGVGLPQPRGRK